MQNMDSRYTSVENPVKFLKPVADNSWEVIKA